MRNRQQVFIFLCALMLALAAGWLHDARAQETQSQNQVNRTWGLGATFQGGQTLIVVPVWLGQRFVVAPIVSATHTENANLLLNAGAGIRLYPSMSRIAPFWGVAATATINKPQTGSGNSSTIWTAGGFFGGEFFINQRFSFSIQPGVWASFPPNSGPITITTATFLFGTIYF